MSDPVRALPSGGPGCWRRWLLPVLASAAWLVLTLGLYRHAIRGEQAHLLELCHTRLAATALRDDLPRLEGELAAARKMAADPAVPAAQTAEALRRAAHALKNSAATLCLGELRLRAAALEQAARRVLAGTPDNAEGLEPPAAACAAALARAGDALRREKE